MEERFNKMRDKRDAFRNNQDAIKARQAEAVRAIEEQRKARIVSAHLSKFGKNAHLYNHLLPKDVVINNVTDPVKQIDLSKISEPKLERKRRYKPEV